MKKYLEILKKCPLFGGMKEEDMIPMLGCIGASVKTYRKGEFILAEGLPAREIGILLSGALELTQTDYHGNKNLLATVHAGELFGESFACAGLGESPLDAVATADCKILLLRMEKILRTCHNACSFHNQMIFNLVHVLAAKNVAFQQKLTTLSKRSTREKVLTYLLFQSKRQGKAEFDIPLDRQALADYLGVDRSGLCVELSKLSREGVLSYHKNHFTLH